VKAAIAAATVLRSGLHLLQLFDRLVRLGLGHFVKKRKLAIQRAIPNERSRVTTRWREMASSHCSARLLCDRDRCNNAALARAPPIRLKKSAALDRNSFLARWGHAGCEIATVKRMARRVPADQLFGKIDLTSRESGLALLQFRVPRYRTWFLTQQRGALNAAIS